MAIKTFGSLSFDLITHTATIGGERIKLSGKESAILAILAAKPSKTFSQGELLAAMYAPRDMPEPKIIDVFMCKLRKKLARASDGESFIETVWGSGYTMATSR